MLAVRRTGTRLTDARSAWSAERLTSKLPRSGYGLTPRKTITSPILFGSIADMPHRSARMVAA
jgi:hypothetical protein